MSGTRLSRVNDPIRSVHITNYYHESSGGVRSNYDKLLRAADRRKRFVTLIVPGRSARSETVGEFGRIHYVAATRSPIFDSRYRVILPNQYLFTDSALRKILLNENPDIVEVYDNYALTFLAGMTRMGYFKRLKRPMFVYFTGERFDTIFKTFVLGGRVGGWFSRRTLGNFNLPMFDYYIANSSFVANELLLSFRSRNNPRRWEWFHDRCMKFFKAFPEPIEERLAVCPRGVNTQSFSPTRRSADVRERICRSAGVPFDAKLVVSATRLSPEKNVRLLPQIMEELARDESFDLRLLIAGSGPEQSFLANEAKRFGGKMVLIGQLDTESLADLYANADVFLHPNPREPFGNVGLEAMSSGTACVFPDSGGVLTYAEHSNAWLVEPTAHGFYEAIREILDNEGLRQLKITNAIETAVHHNEDSAIDQLFDTYDRFYQSFKSRDINTKRFGNESTLKVNTQQRRV